MINQSVVIVLTDKAMLCANIIKEKYPCDIATITKYNSDDVDVSKESFDDLVMHCFNCYNVLIFIMATGIVVRKICGLIESKEYDPAVIVLDENMNNAISLLSGHLGKANKHTKKLCSLFHMNPVITTASDVSNYIAVDTFADNLKLSIKDYKNAKEITAMIVNDKKIGVVNTYHINFDKSMLPSNISIDQHEKDEDDGLIILGDHYYGDKPYVLLQKRNLTVGIGCRKNKSKKEILDVLIAIVKKHNINLRDIGIIASVDVKESEMGIINVAKLLDCEFKIIKRSEIAKYEHLFEGSAFVKKTIGVSCVSQPTGLIASGFGECIVDLVKENGITLSIWKEK